MKTAAFVRPSSRLWSFFERSIYLFLSIPLHTQKLRQRVTNNENEGRSRTTTTDDDQESFDDKRRPTTNDRCVRLPSAIHVHDEQQNHIHPSTHSLIHHLIHFIPTPSHILTMLRSGLSKAVSSAARTRPSTTAGASRFMSGKLIKFGVDGRNAMLRGVDTLADAVQVSFRMILSRSPSTYVHTYLHTDRRR